MIKKKSIIPSIFTMCNMIMGFFSILYAARYNTFEGNYENLVIAGVLIFVGALFDAFDGAIARALGVVSEIGMQLDSFADAVSYGIAPAVLAYKTFFYIFPEYLGIIHLGYIAAAIFPICAIYRLARFNCQSEMKGFMGLPSPAAGIVVGIAPALKNANILFLGNFYFEMPVYIYLVFYIFIAFLMISRVSYSKLFSDLWHKGVAVRVITVAFIIFLLVAFRGWAIFVVTNIYVIWGIVRFCYKKITE